MQDRTLIIGLTVAVLLAVGWVLFSVGRVALSMIREAHRERAQPRRKLQDPELGLITFEGQLWSGQVVKDGRHIHFDVAGTENGPDKVLAAQLRERVDRLLEFERVALEHIHRQEPSLSHEQLKFDGVDLLFEQSPQLWGMGFTLPDDPEGCWRVEFEGEHPRFVGRDD